MDDHESAHVTSAVLTASVAGIDIKVAVAVIDGLVLFGSMLLTPRFLKYLESD